MDHQWQWDSCIPRWTDIVLQHPWLEVADSGAAQHESVSCPPFTTLERCATARPCAAHPEGSAGLSGSKRRLVVYHRGHVDPAAPDGHRMRWTSGWETVCTNLNGERGCYYAGSWMKPGRMRAEEMHENGQTLADKHTGDPSRCHRLPTIGWRREIWTKKRVCFLFFLSFSHSSAPFSVPCSNPPHSQCPS